MVYIAYFTELNLQICDYAQKRCICCKNCKYALDENFHGHFCPPRKAAKFCHPGVVRPNYARIFDKSLISSWERREGGRVDVSAETLADISEVTTI